MSDIFRVFFAESKAWLFIQSIIWMEMSSPIFCENKKTYLKCFVSCYIYIQQDYISAYFYL